MRLTGLYIVTVLICTLSLQAQKPSLRAGQDGGVHLVPVKVHQKFVLENPDVEARWKTDQSTFTAQYINPLNNMGYMIVYDTAGTVIRREKELENQDYPAPINDFFSKEFPGEGYVIWSSTDSAGNAFYYCNHNTRLLKFDKNGNPLDAKRTRGYDTLAPATVK
jgi:hypothetical protein